MWAGWGRVLRICRKQSREVGGMYAKPGADCCAETEYRDEPTGGDVITTNARVGTDCDVTAYVTPPHAAQQQQPDQLARPRSQRRVIRCSVCATVITSRSDGDVTAADDQSRRALTSAPARDDVNVSV